MECSASHSLKTIIYMECEYDGATESLRERIIELTEQCVEEGLFESIETSLQKEAYVLLPKCVLPVTVNKQVRGEMNELLTEECLAPFQVQFVSSSVARLCKMADVFSELTLSLNREEKFRAPVIVVWRTDEIFAQLIGCESVIGSGVRNALVLL